MCCPCLSVACCVVLELGHHSCFVANSELAGGFLCLAIYLLYVHVRLSRIAPRGVDRKADRIWTKS